MCGIAGVMATKDYLNPSLSDDVEIMTASMLRRGPDASGLWVSEDDRVVLGHRRLAIIDLSDEANQPMMNCEDSLSIVFNGEIYNFQELKNDLIKNHRITFRTNSDTEVLLALYSVYGLTLFEKLRGMYAIALWDKSKSSLLLSRDGYGIKPLYYYYDGKRVIFASQVKALLKCKGLHLTTSAGGVVSFLTNGYVEEPFTLYNEIKSIPAGSSGLFMLHNDHVIFDLVPHTCIRSIWHEASKIIVKESDAFAAIEEALVETVRYHMISDVPVGLFLSSGIDSVSLLGLMQKQSKNKVDIKSLCLGFSSFDNTANDETNLAAEVANYFQSEHHTKKIGGDDLSHFYEEIFNAMDQPSIDGINTWLVSKLASDLGLKVAISGLGGDELFGGYPTFTQLGRMAKLTRLGSRSKKFTKLYEYMFDKFSFLSNHLHPKAKYIMKHGGSIRDLYGLKRCVFMTNELYDFYDYDFIQKGMLEIREMTSNWKTETADSASNFMEVSYLESTKYMRNQLLRDSDWASMYHSLEVRTPLVDTHLLKKIAPYLLSIKQPNKKSILLKSSGINSDLKNKILNRPKSGFTTPMSAPSKGIKLKGDSWDKHWTREVLGRYGFRRGDTI